MSSTNCPHFTASNLLISKPHRFGNSNTGNKNYIKVEKNRTEQDIVQKRKKPIEHPYPYIFIHIHRRLFIFILKCVYNL